jgi:hypothetical protein
MEDDGPSLACDADSPSAPVRWLALTLGDWLVSTGLALDWPKYSKGKYERAQHEADQAERGIWARSYVAPWLYCRCIKDGGKPGGCSDDANGSP